MNVISSLIRMLCGVAVLALTWSSWSKNKEALSGETPLNLYGQTMSGGTAGMTMGVFALIGLGLLWLGLVGLLKGKK